MSMRKRLKIEAGFIRRLGLFSALFIILFLASRILEHYVGSFSVANFGVFHATIGDYLGVGATLLLAYIAWEQLRNLAETSSAQFLLELKEDLFTAETRTLFHLFELKWLTFHETGEKNIAWFEVNTEAIAHSSLPKEIKDKLTERKVYSTYEVDDWVLGPLEDVGLLLKRKILPVAVIYEEFSTFYELTLTNEAIQEYLAWLRLESSDFYDNIEYAANQCEEYRGKKRSESKK